MNVNWGTGKTLSKLCFVSKFQDETKKEPDAQVLYQKVEKGDTLACRLFYLLIPGVVLAGSGGVPAQRTAVQNKSPEW